MLMNTYKVPVWLSVQRDIIVQAAGEADATNLAKREFIALLGAFDPEVVIVGFTEVIDDAAPNDLLLYGGN